MHYRNLLDIDNTQMDQKFVLIQTYETPSTSLHHVCALTPFFQRTKKPSTKGMVHVL